MEKEIFTNLSNSGNFTSSYMLDAPDSNGEHVSIHVNAELEGKQASILIRAFGIDRPAYKDFVVECIEGSTEVKLAICSAQGDSPLDIELFHSYDFALKTESGKLALELKTDETVIVSWKTVESGVVVEHPQGSVILDYDKGVLLYKPEEYIKELQEELESLPDFLADHIIKKIDRIKKQYGIK